MVRGSFLTLLSIAIIVSCALLALTSASVIIGRSAITATSCDPLQPYEATATFSQSGCGGPLISVSYAPIPPLSCLDGCLNEGGPCGCTVAPPATSLTNCSNCPVPEPQSNMLALYFFMNELCSTAPNYLSPGALTAIFAHPGSCVRPSPYNSPTAPPWIKLSYSNSPQELILLQSYNDSKCSLPLNPSTYAIIPRLCTAWPKDFMGLDASYVVAQAPRVFNNPSPGMSTGAIVGIVIVSLLGGGAIMAVVVYFGRQWNSGRAARAEYQEL